MGEPYVVRAARAADLRHVADIEASGAQQFLDLFGPDLNPVLLSTPATGASRAGQPGFLLVAAPPGASAPWERGPRSEPVGFAHVLELDDTGRTAHLEQLSVRPEVQRRGIGTALVRAAMTQARLRGHRRLSLCTFRDVPWNGPFYTGLGFAEVDRPTPFQQRLRDHEEQLGLSRGGVRSVMDVALTR